MSTTSPPIACNLAAIPDAERARSTRPTLTIAVDLAARCRTSSGSAKTTVGSRQIDTTITRYQVCYDASGEEGCPSGSVDHEAVISGRSVEVQFDGSAEAEVTGPRGDTFEVPLVCTAAVVSSS